MAGGNRAPVHGSAFTIIEMVVVVGVVLILVGLLAPALGAARAASRLMADTSLMRSNATAIQLYCTDYRDVFPINGATVFNAAGSWASAVVRAGVLSDLTAADPLLDDPWATDRDPFTHHILTYAAVYDWRRMQFGSEGDPIRDAPHAVRQSDVALPALKGLLFNHFIRYGRDRNTLWCCLSAAPVGPVAFADGSLTQGRWWQFVPFPERPIVNSIGNPVLSTWEGIKGRDKP
ncbi:MAG: hypothetical protein KIT68_08785 [Phycisphaeraceae bacterium]|nr:hypothetical protein [Phycisphaeraceae bacterium]